ncbi:hypothetical protein [Nostoc sp. CCY 9925]
MTLSPGLKKPLWLLRQQLNSNPTRQHEQKSKPLVLALAFSGLFS